MINGEYIKRINSNEAILWQKYSPVLRHLDIELTERCNNNCIHCYINLPVDNHEAREKELSTNTIKEIIRDAASLGCLSIRFTGGEPLLREDFKKLYLFTRKLGIQVIIFTNATLISPEIADLFARTPPLKRIEVSLYGMKENSYEAVSRSPGSFEAAWRGIKLLLEKKIPFVVKGALLPPNRAEIKEFKAWASSLPQVDRPPSYSMFFDLRCRRDSETKNRLIQKNRVSADESLKLINSHRTEYIQEMIEFCSKFTGPKGDRLFTCGSGVNSACVDAYGYLQPCILLRHPEAVYDLKTGSLKNAMTNFFPMIRKIRAVNPDYIARCARCFLKGLCEQCPAKSWMEHGTMDTPVDYLCEIAHTRARSLGLIDNNQMAWEIEDWRRKIALFTRQKFIRLNHEKKV